MSCNNPYAAAAGLEMMKKGGNAIDAAVAVSLVLGVVEPYHSGIGGGCFHIVYHKESNEFFAVDARGVAPLGAWQDMFLDEDGGVDLEPDRVFRPRPQPFPLSTAPWIMSLKNTGQ